MVCESEDTTNVICFLTLYNEILQKVKGDSSFVWSQRDIMTDENGANKMQSELFLAKQWLLELGVVRDTIYDVLKGRA